MEWGIEMIPFTPEMVRRIEWQIMARHALSFGTARRRTFWAMILDDNDDFGEEIEQ